MCGRTACSLSKQSIVLSTAHKDHQNGQYVRYEWFESNQTNERQKESYEPNFNQTSGHYLPVLVSKKLIDKSCNDPNVKVLTSMKWGLRPDWIKSNDNSFKVNPINCRFETIAEKKTFSSPLNNGRRCVVLVDGFFEWKNIDSKTKDPYFLYFPQKYIDFKTNRINWSQNESKLNEDNQWKGPRLLTIAGIFNKSEDNCLSFSMITVPSHPSLEWLHNRMPAILDTNDSIRNWLDFDGVSAEEAIKLLVPFGGLQYHSVSRLVSNVRNNSFENILPKSETKAKQKTIDHWFTPKSPKTNKKSLKIDDKEKEKEIDNEIKAKKFKNCV